MTDNEFRQKMIVAMKQANFVVPEKISPYVDIPHRELTFFKIRYREIPGHVQIWINGLSIDDPRTLDYSQRDCKAILNLKARMLRLFKRELAIVKKLNGVGLIDKGKIVESVEIFNNSRHGHNVVVDVFDEDNINSLLVYYRTYLIKLHIDEEGYVYTAPYAILNKPERSYSLEAITQLIDVLSIL